MDMDVFGAEGADELAADLLIAHAKRSGNLFPLRDGARAQLVEWREFAISELGRRAVVEALLGRLHDEAIRKEGLGLFCAAPELSVTVYCNGAGWFESKSFDLAHAAEAARAVADVDLVDLLLSDGNPRTSAAWMEVALAAEGRTFMLVEDKWTWGEEHRFVEQVLDAMLERAGLDEPGAAYLDEDAPEWARFASSAMKYGEGGGGRAKAADDIKFARQCLNEHAPDSARVLDALAWAGHVLGRGCRKDGRYLRACPLTGAGS